MNAGDLERQITIQTATVTRSGSTGSKLTDWTTVTATTWAEWIPGGTRESFVGGQTAAYADGVFRIRYRTPVPTAGGSRVVFDGRTYDVAGVIETKRRTELQLVVKARADS
jgi:SPP1 family predicted phage head-tail adaptor